MESVSVSLQQKHDVPAVPLLQLAVNCAVDGQQHGLIVLT